jgi:hypothetical protein
MSKIRGNHRYRTRNSRKNLISAQYDTIQKVFLICFPLPYTNKVKIRCYYYDDYKKRGLCSYIQLSVHLSQSQCINHSLFIPFTIIS